MSPLFILFMARHLVFHHVLNTFHLVSIIHNNKLECFDSNTFQGLHLLKKKKKILNHSEVSSDEQSNINDNCTLFLPNWKNSLISTGHWVFHICLVSCWMGSLIECMCYIHRRVYLLWSSMAKWLSHKKLGNWSWDDFAMFGWKAETLEHPKIKYSAATRYWLNELDKPSPWSFSFTGIHSYRQKGLVQKDF